MHTTTEDDEGRGHRDRQIPDDLKDLADEWHSNLVEKVCELDDDLLEKYLEGEEPSIDEMKKALRKGTIACEAVPVYCWYLHTENKGVQKLLDGVVRVYAGTNSISLISLVQMKKVTKLFVSLLMMNHSAALAFKIMTDPFVGKLAFFRCIVPDTFELRFLCIECYKAEERACWSYRTDAC